MRFMAMIVPTGTCNKGGVSRAMPAKPKRRRIFTRKRAYLEGRILVWSLLRIYLCQRMLISLPTKAKKNTPAIPPAIVRSMEVMKLNRVVAYTKPRRYFSDETTRTDKAFKTFIG